MFKPRISLVPTLIASLLLLTALAAGPLAADPAAEPSYDKTCALWPPTEYQCSILSPKDSRSKFATSFRGGMHTIYVSEVLGHCPLLPERAPLMKYLDQGIQAYFATGAEPDYRDATRADVRQELYKGYLPIMVTRWEGKADGLRYEQTDFVRQIGKRMTIKRGDENSAAMMRLRVINTMDKACMAPVRLCINGSPNGQPRGLSHFTYLAALKQEGSVVRNAKGQMRFMWRTPKGTAVESHLRSNVPKILEWAGSEIPAERPAAIEEPVFNRYYETKLQENHGAHKAFDSLVRSGWVPETTLADGPSGVGLMFPEDRLLRKVDVRFADDNWPMPDGARVEAYDGKTWQPLDCFINGKKVSELKSDDETQKAMGPVWSFALPEPKQMRGFRIMVDKLPAGKTKPEICEVNYNSSLDSAPAIPATQWFDTNGDKLNYVQFSVPVPAKGSASVEVIIPFLPANENETKCLVKADYNEELAGTAKWWTDEAARGTRVQLPEARVAASWNTTLQHMFTNAERVPSNGFTITKTNLGWYEAIWASLAAPEILALDERGYHDDAARYLEPFVKWQGTVDPGGEYKSKEGFLTTANDYTWARWVSNHGWILWALCDHYRLSGDRAWLNGKIPNILAACDWIERERKHTKLSDKSGKKVPHWGLLPAGSTGDGAPNCYGFMGDSVTWKALDAAASVLEEIKHPRAKAMRAAVNEYRQCILNGVDWASKNTPQYVLNSGKSVPWIGNDVYNVWKINTGIADPNVNFHGWWLDVGPLYLIDLGVLDAKSELSGYLLQAAEERWMKGNVSNSEPFYMPERGVYYGRDDVDGYLEMFYTLLAEGMDRQTYVTAEYHHGIQNFVFSDAEFSRTIRQMLLCENGKSIDLAAMTPRAWLENGKRISIADARTYFGIMSLEINSNAAKGKITAKVTPPNRVAVPMRLRLRHPKALSIKKVSINGNAYTSFAGEWIKLPAGKKPLNIVAYY